MTLNSLSTALLRAEKKLGTEMFVRLQADASGSVSTFADVDIFRFDSVLALTDWLRSPRIVEYDEEGERKEATRMAAETIDYDQLPEHLRAGMRRYIEHGIETGSFLRACLENNYEEACLRSDMTSGLPDPIFSWVRMFVPAEARGSSSKVEAWIVKHRPRETTARPEPVS